MLEDVIPISPVHFFDFQFDCHYVKAGKKTTLLDSKYLLPDISYVKGDDAFADVAMGWNENGIYFLVKVKRPILKVEFPDLQNGDSLEIFIDTRDVKNSGFNTKFCHHFYFLPEKLIQDKEDISQAGEITRFRNEDAHELCDPSLLVVATVQKSTSYQMNIFIPKECLYGFDPQQFQRLGFNYRINRFDENPQIFCGSTDLPLDQQPSIWPSFLLVS